MPPGRRAAPLPFASPRLWTLLLSSKRTIRAIKTSVYVTETCGTIHAGVAGRYLAQRVLLQCPDCRAASAARSRRMQGGRPQVRTHVIYWWCVYDGPSASRLALTRQASEAKGATAAAPPTTLQDSCCAQEAPVTKHSEHQFRNQGLVHARHAWRGGRSHAVHAGSGLASMGGRPQRLDPPRRLCRPHCLRNGVSNALLPARTAAWGPQPRDFEQGQLAGARSPDLFPPYVVRSLPFGSIMTCDPWSHRNTSTGLSLTDLEGVHVRGAGRANGCGRAA